MKKKNEKKEWLNCRNYLKKKSKMFVLFTYSLSSNRHTFYLFYFPLFDLANKAFY